MSQHLKLGFLASRNGSSARAIVAAIKAGELNAQALLMISNNRNAGALTFAAEEGIPALHVPTQADPDAADDALRQALESAGVELVVLSGYLRRLGPKTLTRYRNRVLNIHPGPLPEFGGHGMYGRAVHAAVVAAGVSESEACIHVVDEEYDHGPVIARRSAPILEGDTAEALEARVTALEPILFVETLRRISQGEIRLPG